MLCIMLEQTVSLYALQQQRKIQGLCSQTENIFYDICKAYQSWLSLKYKHIMFTYQDQSFTNITQKRFIAHIQCQ